MSQDRILVVEDDPSIRRILMLQLEAAGYKALEAIDGVAALQLLKREVPDLVLLDMMVPNMDGHAVCKAIRADPSNGILPVVMVTAKGVSPA